MVLKFSAKKITKKVEDFQLFFFLPIFLLFFLKLHNHAYTLHAQKEIRAKFPTYLDFFTEWETAFMAFDIYSFFLDLYQHKISIVTTEMKILTLFLGKILWHFLKIEYQIYINRLFLRNSSEISATHEASGFPDGFTFLFLATQIFK